MLINLIHKIELSIFADSAVCELAKYDLIVFRIDYNGNVLIIFRRAPEHRRSADIYVFDSFLKLYVGLFYSLFERIQINDHNVYSIYVELFKLLHMLFIGTHCQKPCVYGRMKGFDSSVKAFGETCYIAYTYYLYTSVFEYVKSTARRYYLITETFEVLCQVNNTCFIRNAYERSFFHFHTYTSLLILCIIELPLPEVIYVRVRELFSVTFREYRLL